MEQKQLKQFTFYDLYAELMDVLNEEERGKLLRCMCEYMFTDVEHKALTDKKLIYLWGMFDYELPNSEYKDCKSLYQILTHNKEIVSGIW